LKQSVLGYIFAAAPHLLLILLLAVAISYAWELAQTPLYSGAEFPGAFWHCFVASLGDGFLVLLIYAAVAAISRSRDWYLRPDAASYAALAATGLAVGFAVEWWGLHIAQRWTYSRLMPLVPWTGIGIVPILQMLVLPPAIFAIARRIRGNQ
jgi:hypothetical protein